jgi:hypothetical protein
MYSVVLLAALSTPNFGQCNGCGGYGGWGYNGYGYGGFAGATGYNIGAGYGCEFHGVAGGYGGYYGFYPYAGSPYHLIATPPAVKSELPPATEVKPDMPKEAPKPEPAKEAPKPDAPPAK